MRGKFETALMAAAAFAAALMVMATGGRAEDGDSFYRCEDGSTMTYSEAERAMNIRGAVDGFAVSIPYQGAVSRFSYFSPSDDDNDIGSEKPPFVMYWQPAKGPPQIYYDLGDGRVDCHPVD